MKRMKQLLVGNEKRASKTQALVSSDNCAKNALSMKRYGNNLSFLDGQGGLYPIMELCQGGRRTNDAPIQSNERERGKERQNFG